MEFSDILISGISLGRFVYLSGKIPDESPFYNISSGISLGRFVYLRGEIGEPLEYISNGISLKEGPYTLETGTGTGVISNTYFKIIRK